MASEGTLEPLFLQRRSLGPERPRGQSLATANWPAGQGQALSLSQGLEDHSAVALLGQLSEPGEASQVPIQSQHSGEAGKGEIPQR